MDSPKDAREVGLAEQAAPLLRPAEEVMRPERLGAVWPTRFSFSRMFLRYAARHRWHAHRVGWKLDENGRGEAVYRVDTQEDPLFFAVISNEIAEAARTDRVIATSWDVAAALCEGALTEDRLERMRVEVTVQEDGRADPATPVWTRGNRSSRLFEYAVDSLAAGTLPTDVAEAGYVLRSTAFYANGKWGTTPFDALAASRPLKAPYRAQMLAAWLFREFGYDLVEHMAGARAGKRRRFPAAWRRYLGIGNATGLGMVPFVINHPKILNAWCLVRETALANAKAKVVAGTDPEVRRLRELIDRARVHFEEQKSIEIEPFESPRTLAEELASLAILVRNFEREGKIDAVASAHPWLALTEWAERELSLEGQELLNSLLIELYDELDDELEHLFHVDEASMLEPAARVGQLRQTLEHSYSWALALDFSEPSASHYFWYSSASSEEPRKGVRGVEPGEQCEHPIDVARQLGALHTALQSTDDDLLVGEFLLAQPEHWGIVERIQSVASLPYAEVRGNLLDSNFLPLHLQRFQLAMYGMERFRPQSTDWLRITLFQGAARPADVAAGAACDQMFVPRP